MAYDEKLAQRIREIVFGVKGASERKMFGGIAFMVDGHMCAGVIGEELMARFDPGLHGFLLAKKHVRPMDFTGRPAKGCLFVGIEGIRTGRQLAYWVGLGIAHARSLPPRTPRKGARTGSGIKAPGAGHRRPAAKAGKAPPKTTGRKSR